MLLWVGSRAVEHGTAYMAMAVQVFSSKIVLRLPIRIYVYTRSGYFTHSLRISCCLYAIERISQQDRGNNIDAVQVNVGRTGFFLLPTVLGSILLLRYD